MVTPVVTETLGVFPPCSSCANISHARLMDTTTQVGSRAMNPFGIAGDEEHTWAHLPEKSGGAGRPVPGCSGAWLSLASRAAQTYNWRQVLPGPCGGEGGAHSFSDTPHPPKV